MTADDTLYETVKMAHCPGIVFASGISGRRARIAGSGIDVWEIIAHYQHMDHDEQRLREAFDFLTPEQIEAALGYYALYSSEIDELIARNEAWTEDTVRELLAKEVLR
jgi:uncharacterized protein (DUF433 family)